jgi:quinol monooxygenase YgiN
MHVQIVNFQLKGLTEADYTKLSDDLAPQFAAIPGLVSKVWLANATTKTFGGVYLWHDRAAMDAFSRTPLFQAVVTHPNLANLTSTDFAVLEAPSRVTRGMAEVGV